MPAIQLDADFGMLDVSFGDKKAKLDPYAANDAFNRMRDKYVKECEAKEELPIFSELYPKWATAVTGFEGVGTPVAIQLHKLVIEAIEDEKKADDGLNSQS